MRAASHLAGKDGPRNSQSGSCGHHDNCGKMVAANLNARITVWGFAIFTVASIAWIADGVLEGKTSLGVQNVVLLLINVLGVWRWLPRAGKEAGAI